MFKRFILALSTCLVMGQVAWAQNQEPLFINLHSDGNRGTMALTFGTRQVERGHPVTFFVNDQALRMLSSKHAKQYSKQQELIETLLDKGAVILAAPMFMQEYGVSKDDLLPGIKLSSPEIGSIYLFKPNTLTLSW